MKSKTNQLEQIKILSDSYTGCFFPKAVNIILTNKCNYQCKFCFGQYNFLDQWPDDSKNHELLAILSALGVDKVTFEGGEPFLHPNLHAHVVAAKNLGLTTSIISNGSLITQKLLANFSTKLDWLGLSIDSASDRIEKKLGRGYGNHVAQIENVAKWAHSLDIKVKINVVVNRMNFREDMSELLISLNPSRIKMFQCLEIAGENDAGLSSLSISTREYNEFVSRHIHLRQRGLDIVFEESQDMINSYLMILPDGRLLSNHYGKYQATERNLFNAKPSDLLSEIQWNNEAYIFRGGEYQW